MHISFGFDEEDAAYIVWDVFSSIILVYEFWQNLLGDSNNLV